jgi:hypothetical protein
MGRVAPPRNFSYHFAASLSKEVTDNAPTYSNAFDEDYAACFHLYRRDAGSAARTSREALIHIEA